MTTQASTPHNAQGSAAVLGRSKITWEERDEEMDHCIKRRIESGPAITLGTA